MNHEIQVRFQLGTLVNAFSQAVDFHGVPNDLLRPNDMPSRVLWRQAVAWTVASSCFVVFVFLHQQQTSWKQPYLLSAHDYFSYNLESEEPPDPSQLCQVPRIHPFDPSILNYLSPTKPIVCKVRQLPLTFVDENSFLRFNDTAVRLSGYIKKHLSCKYREVLRVNQSDTEVSYGDAKPLPPTGVKLQEEFVSVSCYNFAGIAFYTNFHAHVVRKHSHDVHKSIHRTTEPTSKPYLNVLILGIDSLSRLSFIRNLPKTYSFLTQQMKAFIFRGMTKVGDNTFPNLAAMLTGKSALDGELPTVLTGGTYNSWPCVWKNFSERGYITMFAEDRPDIALFNYLREGFRDPPTDHYLRPYWLAVESSSLHRLSSHMCFGSIPKHILQLNYTRDFVIKYAKDSPFFGFSFFVELSHDYISQVSVADDDLESWLRDLYVSGYFNHTIFFFMSDHGHRFDAMRATLVGRIEERLPFFAMYIPKHIQQSEGYIRDNLRVNLGRLTSPYDTYYTLLDILKYSTENTPLGQMSSSRGSTLFGPIPANRTCSSAGIPDHYCVCEEERTLAPGDPRAEKAATVLVETLNNLLKGIDGNLSICSRLSISNINRVDLIVSSRKVLVNSRVYFGSLVEDGLASGMMSKLRVIIRTKPGEGLFEATVMHREDENIMTVLGDISRINAYGSQSRCVRDPVMKKFCYCADGQPAQSTPDVR